MNSMILILLLFLVGIALFFSVLYFVIEVPRASRAMRVRLEAIEELGTSSEADSETALLREDVLSHISLLQRLFVRIRPIILLNLFIQQSALNITVGMILLASLSLALFAGLTGSILRYPFPLVLLVALCLGAVPFWVVAHKRQRRFMKLEEQFPDAMDLLSRAVRAGHAFTTGMQLIGSEMPEPVAGEFRRTFEQQNFGLPLRDALNNLLVRVPLPDIHVFVTALVIQRDSGGNLAEILDNLSRVIRERFKLMRQVRVYTAQGRMSMYVMLALPPLAALGMSVLNPSYLAPLFNDPMGQKALTLAAILQLSGFLIIRKIIQPKV